MLTLKRINPKKPEPPPEKSYPPPLKTKSRALTGNRFNLHKKASRFKIQATSLKKILNLDSKKILNLLGKIVNSLKETSSHSHLNFRKFQPRR